MPINLLHTRIAGIGLPFAKFQIENSFPIFVAWHITRSKKKEPAPIHTYTNASNFFFVVFCCFPYDLFWVADAFVKYVTFYLVSNMLRSEEFSLMSYITFSQSNKRDRTENTDIC